MTRPHDNVKVVVIGSSLQNDNAKMRTYGAERLLPFELYIRHFEQQKEFPIENITLTTNYRGQFANYADKVQQTVQALELESFGKQKGAIMPIKRRGFLKQTEDTGI